LMPRLRQISWAGNEAGVTQTCVKVVVASDIAQRLVRASGTNRYGSKFQRERAMNRDNRRKVLAAVFVLLGLPLNVIHAAQAQEKLAGYNAAIGESSISGISSGAFMAVQFATAWSSVITGVGVVAGGPHWCAKADSFFGFWTSLSNALGPCLSGPLDVNDFIANLARATSNSATVTSPRPDRRSRPCWTR
jgi:hypothetical protein